MDIKNEEKFHKLTFALSNSKRGKQKLLKLLENVLENHKIIEKNDSFYVSPTNSLSSCLVNNFDNNSLSSSSSSSLSNDYVLNKDFISVNNEISIISCKPKDVVTCLNVGLAHVGVGYNDLIYFGQNDSSSSSSSSSSSFSSSELPIGKKYWRIVKELDDDGADLKDSNKNKKVKVCLVCHFSRYEELSQRLKYGGRYANTLHVVSEFPRLMFEEVERGGKESERAKMVLDHCASFIQSHGSVETFLAGNYYLKRTKSMDPYDINPKVDAVITIVESGATLRKHDLVILCEIMELKPCIFIRRQRWQLESPQLRTFIFKHLKLPIYIDGIDGSGKTTLVKNLKNIFSKLQDNDIDEKKYNIYDRGPLTKLSLKTCLEWPDSLLDFGIYIILDCDIDIACERCSVRNIQDNQEKDDYWEKSKQQFYYRHVFRALAAKYGLYFIDTTSLTEKNVLDIVLNRLEDYVIPRIDKIDHHMIEEYYPSIVNQGNSKTIRSLVKNKYDLVTYIPSVYSHRNQRAAIIENTDQYRRRFFQCILHVLWANEISHSSIYVGNQHVLVEHIDNNEILPIEICVKNNLVGTDKHSYYGLENQTQIFKFPNNQSQYLEYKQPLVRFDWRNPNHDPNTGQPIGDKALYDDLASLLLGGPHILQKTKSLVKNTFNVLRQFLNGAGLEILDICMMCEKSGSKLYYEISQDCARLKLLNSSSSSSSSSSASSSSSISLIDVDKDLFRAVSASSSSSNSLIDVDKDLFRAGATDDVVANGWKKAAEMVEEYLPLYLKNVAQVLGD